MGFTILVPNQRLAQGRVTLSQFFLRVLYVNIKPLEAKLEAREHSIGQY